MAPLIDDARQAREEAARLRAESLGLRLAVRRQMARRGAAIERLEDTLDWVRPTVRAPRPSPWSALQWRANDPELERVLVGR